MNISYVMAFLFSLCLSFGCAHAMRYNAADHIPKDIACGIVACAIENNDFQKLYEFVQLVDDSQLDKWVTTYLQATPNLPSHNKFLQKIIRRFQSRKKSLQKLKNKK